jgi:SNF2 family DNA or RNA helicase
MRRSRVRLSSRGFDEFILTLNRLDLTVANKAYIMEPQWNPMVEDQAFDRIYRIGQTREVTTVRYVMKGSFEEVMEHGGEIWTKC